MTRLSSLVLTSEHDSKMRFSSFSLKGILTALTLVFAMQAAVAQEEAVPAAAVAVVDFDWVLTNSVAWKESLVVQVEEKRQAIQNEAKLKEDELKRKGQELEGQQAILSPEVFAQKDAEFKKELSEAQKYFNLRKAKLDSAFQNAKIEIEKTIAKAVAEVGNKKGANLIMKIGNRGSVFFFEPKMNISVAVLERTNAMLSSVVLTVE